MERPKTYTMEELHRLDPAKVIRYDGRPMQVNEVIQHLCRDDWPAEPVDPKTTTQQEH
jgi:hypothetical protein